MATDIILDFQKGGIWMWAILFFQIFSLAIIAERIWFLFVKRKLGYKNYAENFAEDIRRGNVQAVVDRSQKDWDTTPMSRAIHAGAEVALNYGGSEEMQGRMDENLLVEASQLEKRTHFLVMLGNVGTLTGLLGTIVGMIKAFSAVTYANPSEKATLLSSGISEAMNTTAYGLIMAIPALFMYAVLHNRANELQEDQAQGALRIFNLLSYKYQPVVGQNSSERVTER